MRKVERGNSFVYFQKTIFSKWRKNVEEKNHSIHFLDDNPLVIQDRMERSRFFR
jgi:hypothetical protein